MKLTLCIRVFNRDHEKLHDNVMVIARTLLRVTRLPLVINSFLYVYRHSADLEKTGICVSRKNRRKSYSLIEETLRSYFMFMFIFTVLFLKPENDLSFNIT